MSLLGERVAMHRYLLLFLLSFVTVGAHSAPEMKEGQQYQLLASPLPVAHPGKIEVVELFWYGCSHCFHFEPLIAEWLKTKPADVEFRRVPAVFAQNWVPHARAYFAAEALGALDKFHTSLFRALHEEDKKIFDEESLIKFAAGTGINESEFRSAYAGFAIDGKVKQAMAYTRDSGITGVPSIIINGKYRTGAQLAGGQDQVLKVVNFLVDKERAH